MYLKLKGHFLAIWARLSFLHIDDEERVMNLSDLLTND
jgi:hypothetical protein